MKPTIYNQLHDIADVISTKVNTKSQFKQFNSYNLNSVHDSPPARVYVDILDYHSPTCACLMSTYFEFPNACHDSQTLGHPYLKVEINTCDQYPTPMNQFAQVVWSIFSNFFC